MMTLNYAGKSAAAAAVVTPASRYPGRRCALLPLVELLLALEIMILPIWAGLAMVWPGAVLVKRLMILLAPIIVILVVVGVFLGIFGSDGIGLDFLRAQAVVVGFAVLLAGLASMIGRLAGPRITQVLTAFLGWSLVAGIILAGAAADLTRGDVQATIVRFVVHANPLVVAERELGLDWLHSNLTYRLSPLGDSYSYLLQDVGWWKTALAFLFVGSGMMVFSIKRGTRNAERGTER
jgi:hypothetical protein